VFGDRIESSWVGFGGGDRVDRKRGDIEVSAGSFGSSTRVVDWHLVFFGLGGVGVGRIRLVGGVAQRSEIAHLGRVGISRRGGVRKRERFVQGE
jgi:hypothetical protein